MTIDIEQLKADRAAGTEGPWGVKYYNIHALGRCIAKMDWTIRDSVDAANARRISRLPELEAAFIEARQIIKDVLDNPPVALCECGEANCLTTRCRELLK